MIVAALQVLNKILQTKNYNFIKTNSLTAAYFKGYEAEFNFIEEHYKKFGNIPDELTFVQNFPNFDLTEVNETDDYLLDRLQEDYGYHKMAPILRTFDEKLKEDSRLAYNYLLSEMANMKPHTVCKGIDIIANAAERWEKYEARKTEPDAAVIKTGFKELDDVFGGWEYGDELVTIVARTNMGKSWLLLKFMSEAWKQGKRVGLYSGEMSHLKLGYRFDALFGHFSNKCLTQGGQVDGYQDYINQLTTVQNPFIIITQKEFGGRPTVQKIRNFVEENQIEILGIDQFSLMEDGRAKGNDPTRLRMAHIAEDLFLLSSEYRIPILGLAQANREAVKKEGEMDAPGIENIKECDDIAHNSSKCIGMKQSNFGLVLDVIKNREGRVGDKLLYSWDIDSGHFSYIPSGDDAVSAPVRQQVKQEASKQAQSALQFNPF